MCARATVMDIGYMMDEITSICYKHNKDNLQINSLVKLPGYIISDLVVYKEPTASSLPHIEHKQYPSLFNDDDLYKLGKYIIIGELLENNVPYGQIIRLIKILEESIMTCLSEYDISLRDIVKVDIIQTTAILWVL